MQSTPLHMAVVEGCVGVVQELLKSGAKLDIKDIDGKVYHSHVHPYVYLCVCSCVCTGTCTVPACTIIVCVCVCLRVYVCVSVYMYVHCVLCVVWLCVCVVAIDTLVHLCFNCILYPPPPPPPPPKSSGMFLDHITVHVLYKSVSSLTWCYCQTYMYALMEVPADLLFHFIFFIQFVLKIPFEVAATNQMRRLLVEARKQPVVCTTESCGEKKCMICVDNPINTILLPCGHQVRGGGTWGVAQWLQSSLYVQYALKLKREGGREEGGRRVRWRGE